MEFDRLPQASKDMCSAAVKVFDRWTSGAKDGELFRCFAERIYIKELQKRGGFGVFYLNTHKKRSHS